MGTETDSNGKSRNLRALCRLVWHAKSVLLLLLSKHFKENLLQAMLRVHFNRFRKGISQKVGAANKHLLLTYPEPKWIFPELFFHQKPWGADRSRQRWRSALARLWFQYRGNEERVIVPSAQTKDFFRSRLRRVPLESPP